jgi:membrane-associated protein
MEWLSTLIDFILLIPDFILHIDKHLGELIANYGVWCYAILFIIVFCETGLVVAPYLPGDSLLFAAGAFAGLGHFDPFLLAGLLFVAAVLGDGTNYWIARKARVWILAKKDLPFIKEEHIVKTQTYFDRYGGKTIVIARFIPIVRTFAPFVAGIGQMNYKNFTKFNLLGALLWIGIFVPAGFFLGNNEVVRKNFTIVILGIIVVSVVPIVIEFVLARSRKSKGGPA